MGLPARKRRKVTPPTLSCGKDHASTTLDGVAPRFTGSLRPAALWNSEQGYEQRPRRVKNSENGSTRLPIKTADGQIKQLRVPETEGDGDSWPGSEDDSNKVLASDSESKSESEESLPKVSARQELLDAKEEMARIASLIMEDREEHAGGFRILKQYTSSSNTAVKKWALKTQLAVYLDVIDYDHPLKKTEVAEKLSKEVRRRQASEQALIGSYQSYIEELAKCAKSTKGDLTGVSSLAGVATSCACELFLAKPHFNFRKEILQILIGKLSSRKVDADFVKCREALETIFRADEDGTPSLEAVTLLTRMMKARDYRIDESVLDTFLHLRLLSEFSSKGSQSRIDRSIDEGNIKGKKPKPKKEFWTKKQRKIEKQNKAIEKEFNQTDAIVSHEERDRKQSETLKLVFVTYFRILKARTPKLMGAVLEGLAKYAHLINQDFFGDLLETLRELTRQADNIDDVDKEMGDIDANDERNAIHRDGTRESLLCIITAFALLEGQDARKAASTPSFDLSFFTAHLYRTLHSLAINPDIELNVKSMRLPDPQGSTHTRTNIAGKVNIQTTTVLMLRSLSSILLPPTSIRSVPNVRVAAFTKQLLTSSLQFPEKSALATLGLMGKVTKTHARKISGMWNTEERKGDGEFDPFRSDLEVSNPYASTVWEGELLRLHYCPGVRDGAKGIERVIIDVK